MEALSEHMGRQFEDRMVKHLRATFPEQTLPFDDNGLRNLIVGGIKRAEGYGIVFEDDIQRYLEYMMVLSQDFDTNPHTSWAGDILRGGDTDGAQKMTRIDNAYPFFRKREP